MTQRIIKFRLRNVQDKLIGYEKWYPGVYNKEDGYSEAKAQWLYSDNNRDWFPSVIPHRSKDSFTGLTDKNGKEIYEGDIVKQFEKSSRYDGGIGVVEFVLKNSENYPMNCYWAKVSNDEAFTLSDKVEVIGNVWENPELLKGGVEE